MLKCFLLTPYNHRVFVDFKTLKLKLIITKKVIIFISKITDKMLMYPRNVIFLIKLKVKGVTEI